MNFRLMVLILVLINTNPVYGQRSKNEIMADALAAREIQLPGLGMKVLSYEDAKHVLSSENGRYIIKGTLQDNWDGVQRSGQVPAPYPSLPRMIDIEDYGIRFGNPEGTNVLSFVSYSCQGCKSLLRQITSDSFIADHNILVIPVYNNENDKVLVKQLFCAKDREKALTDIFVTRSSLELSEHCKTPQADLNVSLANALKISALPATFVLGSNVVRYGPFDT